MVRGNPWDRRIFCRCEARPFARRAGADCPKGGSHFARQRLSAFPEGAFAEGDSRRRLAFAAGGERSFPRSFPGRLPRGSV